MGRSRLLVRRGLVLGAIVVSAAACGGSDDRGVGAADVPAITAGVDVGAAAPGPSALAGVVFDVRRDPG